jgi:PAS domain S-box-containing protein
MAEQENLDSVQNRIQRAKDQLQAMIDLNPDCMLMLDEARKVVRANRACLDLLGTHSFADVLGQPVDLLFGLDGMEALAAVFGGEGPIGMCRAEARLNGEGRVLQFSRVGREDESDSVFLVVEDITEKLVEDVAVEQAHKLTAVRQLMGAMMHHLNQPLTVIMLRTNMLTSAVSKGRSSDEQVLKSLKEISEMSMKLASLLSKFDSCDNFEIQNYTRGVDIMRIDND